MSEYNHFLTLALPDPLSEISKRLARALDPDTGGYLAFDAMAKGIARSPDEEGNPRPQLTTIGEDYVVYGTPCTAEFAGNVQALQQSAAMLQMAVAQDYATRWPEETPPTQAECQSFIDALLLSDKWGMNTGMEDLGLELINV